MKNKIALLFLSQLLPQKKRWSSLFEVYPDKVGDPHVPLSWKNELGHIKGVDKHIIQETVKYYSHELPKTWIISI